MNLKQRILQRLGALMLASILCLNLNAQHAAVKTNLLYDATLTPNLGVELGLGRKSTMQVLYSLNLWKHPLNNDKMWKHWQLLGEYRWWPCSKFNGHFIGVHAMGGEFDMQKVRFKLPFYNWPSDLRDKRYEGWNAGGGFTYGYQWILGRHWNLEASLGVGYQYISYKRYPCAECGTTEESGHKHYFGRQTGAQPDVRVLNADATTCTATFWCAAPAQCAPPATTTSTPLLSNSNLCQSNTS